MELRYLRDTDKREVDFVVLKGRVESQLVKKWGFERIDYRVVFPLRGPATLHNDR